MANVNMSEKDRTAKKIREKREDDLKLVTGQFKWHERPGGTFVFPLMLYKEDGVITYKFEDGKVYEVPKMVAKHLNSLVKVVHKHRTDENGKRHQEVGQRIHRTSFNPTDFLTIDELNEITSGVQSAVINVAR